MPQEGPPVLGHSHLPQGPIQWWQWSLRPILAQIPNSTIPKAISMHWSTFSERWADVADQMCHATEGLSGTG
jgi:hypothetical protein